MSSVPNLDWQDRLGSGEKYPDANLIRIINKFRRREIFEHPYDAKDLFNLFYRNPNKEKPKRQPNPFMIIRTVLGLVASNKNIKEELGDGIQQSKIAGFVWKGANPDERRNFQNLALKFKDLHKIHFPAYEYRPTPRCNIPKIGYHLEIKTAVDYQPVGAPNSIPVSFNLGEDANQYSDTDILDENFIVGRLNFRQLPTIAVNCPADPNTSQTTAFIPYQNPYNPSSTF